MNAGITLMPIILIRFGLLYILNKEALKRAAFFPRPAGNGSKNEKKHKHKRKDWECAKEEIKEEIHKEYKNWKYYDEWWDAEGENAFNGYVNKKREEKAEEKN